MTRKNWVKFYTEVWGVGAKYKADVKDWAALCWALQYASTPEQTYTINFQDVKGKK